MLSHSIYPSLDFVLGLSTPVKSRKPPKASAERERRGNSMTGYAKRLVRSAITLLKERHGKRNLAFLTLTLPDLAWDEMMLVCSQWGDLARRVMEEISRELARHDLNPENVYVSEIQEERWSRDCVVAPHIHAVFQGRQSGQRGWAVPKEKFREIWERILGNFLGRSLSLPAATRVESIKKCPKRYMTKYMTKGGEVVQEIISAGLREMLPTSWWGASNSLRRRVKEGIIDVPKDTAYMIADHLTEYKQAGIVAWFCRIWLVEDEGGYSVERQLNDEPLETRGLFRQLLSVVGEFASKKAMMSFVPDS